MTIAGVALILYQLETQKEHPNTNDQPRCPSTEAIRRLLVTALDDDDLMTVCFDRFYPVYNEKFGGGMSKSEKVQQLLDYRVRQGTLQDLMEVIKERNPYQYSIYEEHAFVGNSRTRLQK